MLFPYTTFAPMTDYKRLTIAYKEKDAPDLEDALQRLAKAKHDGKIGPFIFDELKKIAKRRKVKA